MFKYFSFTEYALANILNDEFYMNHYEAFNDPFECWADVISGFPNPLEKSDRLLEIFKAWGFDDLNDSGATDNYIEYADSLIDMQPNITAIIDSARITCFSKRADNLLMWSHYADGLRGFCVEFEPELLLLNEPDYSSIYEVEYKETPAIIDTALIAILQDQIDYHAEALGTQVTGDEETSYQDALEDSLHKSNDIFKKMLATKPINWEYEEEIRLITQTFTELKGGDYFKYPPQAIKSVIFGEKMPPKQVTALQYLFESHPFPIEFKTAKRAKGIFDVIIENGM